MPFTTLDLSKQSGTSLPSTITSLDATVLSGNLPALNGSALTNISAGKLNQIIRMESGSETSTTGTAFVNSNLTASITPTATDSKILIFVTDNAMFTHTNSHDDNGMGFRIKRTIGGTDSTVTTDDQPYQGFYSSQRSGTDHNRRQTMSWHAVDNAHNTTSAITYTHQFNVYRGNDNGRGKSVHDNSRGNMTLIEVLA